MAVSLKQTRIGYVIGQLVRGGAERQLYELIRGLDQRRFQCIVYCLSEEILPYGDMIREAGVDLRILKRRGHFGIARILKLAYLLRRDRIDVVHSFLFNANGYAWAARLLAHVPYLVTSARSCQGLGWLRDWVNRIAFRMSDAIVCNGDAVRSFIIRHYQAPQHKIEVVCNGVDLSRFTPGPTDLRSPGKPGKGTVITVGRLVQAKDFDLFLEAASLLAHKNPEVRFVIVGDGPCRETLVGNVSRNGLNGQVSFLGDRADVPQLLQAADIFWLTSAWEGLPNVLLEAMACAKPIVTRDVGACRELVSHGVNGYLVSSRDAEKFADHTLDLLNNPCRAGEMGQAGRRLAEEKFSVPAMIRTTEKLYSSLIQ